MKDTDIAYFAGIIDGEGCVYVNVRKVGGKGRRKTPGFGVKLTISITDECLVNWFKEKCELTSIYYREKPGGNRKPKWQCTWNNSKAEKYLKLVLPHLVIKTQQAILGIELLEHLRNSPIGGDCKQVSEEDVAYRLSIKQKISKLNKRGTNV